ncbi:hypothetical protein V1511DRAFT_495915 [Dipodascopsis uninucleata]
MLIISRTLLNKYSHLAPGLQIVRKGLFAADTLRNVVPLTDVCMRRCQLQSPIHRVRLLHSSKMVQMSSPLSEKSVKVENRNIENNKDQSSRERAAKLVSRLPKSFQPYAAPLLQSPGSYIFTFLLLHEVTAVVPLIFLIWLFNVTEWVPPLPESLIETGKQFFENSVDPNGVLSAEESAKMLLRGASAYAIVKASLPLRIMISIAATPWFARKSVIPLISLMKLMFKPRKVVAKKDLDFTRLPKQ